MALTLYDLAGADPDRRFSPYCWRSKMALAHKGLPFTTVPWHFTEKEALTFSGQGKVPVLVDDGRVIVDSWTIATYLEEHYPQRPSLFEGKGGLAATHFANTWADAALHPAMVRLLATDIAANIDPRDRPYYRQSREARFGKPLEELVADRDQQLPTFRQLLEPLRTLLAAQEYLGGAAPIYLDYVFFGTFQWARCISPFPLLHKSDPLWEWRERLLSAFDGLARKAPAFEV